MNALALLPWVSAWASFGWGMIRFFQKRSGLTWRTALVALLGLFFSGWDFYAIAMSTAGPRAIAGAIVLLLMATILFWCTVRSCGSRSLTAIFEDDQPVHLARGGPYKYVRHPFYTSYTIFWFASWLASGSPVALLSATIMLAVYLVAARMEERKFASSPLAADYAGYRRCTGLMIPRPRLPDRRGEP